MYEEIKEKYNFSSWGKKRKRPGREISILLKNFIPWEEDCLGWKRASKELLTEADDRRIIRTVWDNPEDKNSRVLIDVYETFSRTHAQECLIQILANNQLELLPKGPDDLGEVSFVHPEGIPPAAFWLRGNLCLSVCSFGKKMVDVLSWTYKFDSRMMEKPKVERFILTLTPQSEQVNVEQEVGISFSLPWRLGEDGYYKFFAKGGELFFKEKELCFRAQKKGEAVIEAFALEAGREPYGGRLTLKVE
ncbi:MAG TPA: hypothetical protein ACFYD3_09020 [Candidatus Hypogeohydataceae bacterium YC41]